MAKSMVDEIRNAEKQAADSIRAAKEKADELLKMTAEITMKQAQSIVSTAENDAFKLKNKYAAESVAKAQERCNEAQQNSKEAVKLIVSEIIPN